MITNIRTELTDEERSRLADLLDGKASKRMVSRKEVSIFVSDCLTGALAFSQGKPATPPTTDRTDTLAGLAIVDPEDAATLRGKSRGYIIGWNRVKRGLTARAA